MKMKDLLSKVPYLVIQQQNDWEQMQIHQIANQSQEVKEDTLFVCINGKKTDGNFFAEEAYQRGCRAFLTDFFSWEKKKQLFRKDCLILLVKDPREAWARICETWFEEPAKKLKLIGVTGTKGKTTVCWMIYEMLESLGVRSGLIGTICCKTRSWTEKAGNTTPDAFTIQRYFDKMVKEGCEYVVIEVSSLALKQKRLGSSFFEVAVFTNFSEDHISRWEHKNLEEYRYWKSRLFQRCKIGVVNLDDLESGYMLQRTICKKTGYACQKKEKGCLYAERIKEQIQDGRWATSFFVQGREYVLGLAGSFQVYNALAAMQVIRALKMDMHAATSCLKQIQIPGRMERVWIEKNIVCYVDYAHNPKSLETILKAVRPMTKKKIYLVFGCGGNRSKDRRFEMGRIAGYLADVTIVTSDNPREENSMDIIREIAEGLAYANGTYEMIEDRKEAVSRAVEIAEEGAVLILAGKGHETVQEIGNMTYEMDDRLLLKEASDKWKQKKKGEHVRRYNH